MVNPAIIKEMSYVAVIGAAGLDVFGFPYQDLLHRDSNPGTIKLAVGGVGRNIAENLARMGVKTELISAFSDDFAGKFIRERSSMNKLSLTHSLMVNGMTSSFYVAITDISGDMNWALSDMEIVGALTPSVLEKKRRFIEGASILVVEGNLSESTLKFIGEEFQGIPIFADPVSAAKARKFAPILGNLHCFKLNAMEAEAITGIRICDDESAASAVKTLIERGVRQVFLTMGSYGVYWHDGSGEGFFQLRATAPVNTTGAGDAYMAGLVYGLYKDFPTEKTLRFAESVAAITLESPSAVNAGIGRVVHELQWEQVTN